MKACESPYVAWLRQQGIQLFEGGDIVWRFSHGKALVPAPCAPVFVQLDDRQAKAILKESGAFLVRYCLDPRPDPSNWWYIVCDQYDVTELTHKIRQKINRGKRDCHVRQVAPSWLVHNGYECYRAAFQRYGRAKPLPKSRWQESIRAKQTGPFEFWAVFFGNELAGFCQVVVEPGYATTIVGKYDPQYFKHRPVDFLTHCLAEHYVVGRGLTLNNGMRSVLHDTNMQDFLLTHGFRKQYCRLELVYAPVLSAVVNMTYPARHIIKRMSHVPVVNALSALLVQEESRRACHAHSIASRMDKLNPWGIQTKA
jgi:uncharacterized membrane protein